MYKYVWMYHIYGFIYLHIHSYIFMYIYVYSVYEYICVCMNMYEYVRKCVEYLHSVSCDSYVVCWNLSLVNIAIYIFVYVYTGSPFALPREAFLQVNFSKVVWKRAWYFRKRDTYSICVHRLGSHFALPHKIFFQLHLFKSCLPKSPILPPKSPIFPRSTLFFSFFPSALSLVIFFSSLFLPLSLSLALPLSFSLSLSLGSVLLTFGIIYNN